MIPQMSAVYAVPGSPRAAPSAESGSNFWGLGTLLIRGACATAVPLLAYFICSRFRQLPGDPVPNRDLIPPVPNRDQIPLVLDHDQISLIPDRGLIPLVPEDDQVLAIPTIPAIPAIAPLDQRIRNFEEILDRYLVPTFVPPLDDIYRVCDEVEQVLGREPCLLEINGTTRVVGDIHANLGSLEFCLRNFLVEVAQGRNILFLGDYVDRGKLAPGGPQSVKVIMLLFMLKTMFPDKVFLLRGNHEDAGVNYQYGFHTECVRRYPDAGVDEEGFNAVCVRINRVFDNLSLAAILGAHTFCVHGGISPRLTDLNLPGLVLIRNIPKPLSYYQLSIKNIYGGLKDAGEYNDLAIDLLWSDPVPGANGFSPNRRGQGKYFGPTQVQEFLGRFGLRRILRAHQTAAGGYDDVYRDDTTVTLFSAPDYESPGGNIGATAVVYDDGR
jgi:serine/threonine-protein phosphatase PP1 catalytic subunit